MHNPVLMVTNAGYGETPLCPQAKFKANDIVRLRRRKHLAGLPEKAAVAVVVPPGVPPEYAIADATKSPRPLMITRESRAVRYIVAFPDELTPRLIRECDLLPTDDPPAEVKFGAPP